MNLYFNSGLIQFDRKLSACSLPAPALRGPKPKDVN